MEQKGNSKKKLFYGWVITGVVFLNLAMAYGTQYSFGVLFPSLIEEFRWNRQSLAGAFSLYAFIYSTLGVFLGRWTDRSGPRIVLVFGSICLGLGIGLISQVKVPWHLYVVYGLLASWGMSATYITANPTVVKWFVEKRGLALGLAQSGLGIGIIVIPPLTGWMISAFGWRQACIILGGAVGIVLFSTAFLLVGHPEKMGLLPDGREGNNPPGKLLGSFQPDVTHPKIYQEVSWSAAEAIHTKSFWVLTALFFCTWLFVFLPLVHLVIFAMDIGLSKEAALMALGVLGGFSTLGRLVMGVISDRIGRKPSHDGESRVAGIFLVLDYGHELNLDARCFRCRLRFFLRGRQYGFPGDRGGLFRPPQGGLHHRGDFHRRRIGRCRRPAGRGLYFRLDS